MTLTCYPVPGKAKSKLICRAFAAGAPRSATGSVFFGTEGVMSAFQKAKHGTWWYIDNAYTDPQRQQYFRVTKNDLQIGVRRLHSPADAHRPPGLVLGPADWMRASTGERFKRLGLDLEPWRDVPPHWPILVCPQSDDFMKSTLGRKGDWTAETVLRLRELGVPQWRIKVRPWKRDKKLAYIELRDDLRKASLVVTWSSASAITALQMGVPAISESGSVHALSGPLTAESLANPPRPTDEERLRFFQILADNQFTLDEFRDGTAWRALERPILA